MLPDWTSFVVDCRPYSIRYAVYRYFHEINQPIWKSMTFSVAFGEKNVTGGRVTEINIAGDIPQDDPDSDRWYMLPNAPIKHDIAVVAKQTLPGTITPGRPHIVYVEGDRQIVVDGKMTVEQFAKANPGNYLVVTVEVR
jgi:hypothetical protein